MGMSLIICSNMCYSMAQYSPAWQMECYIYSLQLSSALLPETNFNCTADNIRHLSQVMKVHETLQGAANKVKAIAPIADEWQGLTSRHYQCAWINGHASCSISPQSPLVIALDQAYRCSLISGDYDLCANV